MIHVPIVVKCPAKKISLSAWKEIKLMEAWDKGFTNYDIRCTI